MDPWSFTLPKARGGHIYATIDLITPIYMANAKLFKLHRQFYHPGVQKLYNMIENPRLKDVTPETMRLLKKISNECVPCKKVHVAPNRLRITMGTENIDLTIEYKWKSCIWMAILYYTF